MSTVTISLSGLKYNIPQEKAENIAGILRSLSDSYTVPTPQTTQMTELGVYPTHDGQTLING